MPDGNFRSHNPTAGMVDVGAYVTDLWTYRFLGKGAASTVTGFFVNQHGHRISKIWTGSALQADGTNDPKSFADLAGIKELPNDAWGWIGTASVDLYFDTLHPSKWATDIDAFKTAYANSPYITAGGKISLSRVA